MTRLLAILALCAGLCLNLAAAVYYVSPATGNNSYTGLASNYVSGTTGPVANYDVFRNGGFPAITLNPGDTVYSMGGVLDHSGDGLASSFREKYSGTSNAPITFTNYPGAPDMVISNSGANNSTIQVTGISWVRIFGIDSTNAYRTPNFQFITNCEVGNCFWGGTNPSGTLNMATLYNNSQSNWFHDISGTGQPYVTTTAEDGGLHGFTIGTFYSSSDFTAFNIFERLQFVRSGHDCISVYGPSNAVIGCFLHSEPSYPGTGTLDSPYTNVMWGSRDLELGGTIGNWNLVDGNNFNNAGFVPDEGCHGIEGSDVAYEIIRRNVCMNNAANGITIYGGKVGGTFSGTNYIYQNTLAYNGANATPLIGGFLTNISYPEWQGLMLFVSTTNNRVVNNLGWGNFSPAAWFLNGFGVNVSTWSGNMTNTDPLWRNEINTGGPLLTNPPDVRLGFGSPAIDAGSWLTTITSSSGSGTSFTVADAGYFFWGLTACSRYIPPDAIQLQGQSAPVQIVSISGNTITVASSVTWTNGQGLALPYSGAAPDVGFAEYAPLPYVTFTGGTNITATGNGATPNIKATGQQTK